ncbi:hypothetical protein M9H77_12386 [Catharanthus roseus]|uniref:Uncharacterized protein n=1 Tax=Catharanthus roseus TaxID=4058 RepID=A0ACC0BH89_CATRO|nr:hypothetical protein M9H77_12386 [Catharanthus roseus]
MARIIQARDNNVVPYGMLLTRLFRHLKVVLKTEKAMRRRNFVKRLLSEKKEGSEEGSKKVNTEPLLRKINKKVARKRALEEKEKTEAKAKGQTTQGSSAKKENGKVKVVSFDLKGKAKRLFKKRYGYHSLSASENTQTEKGGSEEPQKEVVEDEARKVVDCPLKTKLVLPKEARQSMWF